MPAIDIALSGDEVQRKIPYVLIYETMSSCKWRTQTRKKKWIKMFTEHERRRSIILYRQASAWAVKGSVPKILGMTAETYDLWQKLGSFCSTL